MPQSYDANPNGTAGAVAAADLDRDGHLDLAVADQTSGTVTVLLNVGSAGRR